MAAPSEILELKRLKNRRLDLRTQAAPLMASLLLSFALVFFNPLFVYFSDPARLGDLPLHFVIQQFAIASGLTFALGTTAVVLGQGFSFAVCFAAIVVFFYSYVLQISFGVFRGDGFSNENALFEAAGWAYWLEPIGIVLAFFAVLFVYRENRTVFALLFGMLFASVGYDVAEHAWVYSAKAGAPEKGVATTMPRDLLEFSDSKPNIVLIVLDAGAGYLIAPLMEEGDRAKRFDGFVHYRNTLSIGSHTMPSAGSLIGGEHYFPDRVNTRNDATIHENVVAAYRWLLGELERHGFETMVVDPAFAKCEELREVGRCRTSQRFKKVVEAESPVEGLEVFDGRTILYFAAFKALPYSLKPWLYRSDAWAEALDSDTQLAASINARYYESRFLDALPQMSHVDRGGPSHFLHIWNAALISPFSLDQECNVLLHQPKGLYAQPARVDATRCALDATARWFEWMIENDVYDNTKIIVVSDHGADHYGERWRTGAARPILFVKDFDQRGKIASSEILMQNSDTPALICAAVGGCEGIGPDPSANPDPDRVAHYFFTKHGNPTWATGNRQFHIFEHHEVRGRVDDYPALRRSP
jgi:hypothetical protein